MEIYEASYLDNEINDLKNQKSTHEKSILNWENSVSGKTYNGDRSCQNCIGFRY